MKIPEHLPWPDEVWQEVDAIWKANDTEQIAVLKIAAHKGIREQIIKFDSQTPQSLVLSTLKHMDDEDKKDPANKKANAFKREVLSEFMAEWGIELFDKISDVRVKDSICIGKEGFHVLKISDKGILAVPDYKYKCYQDYDLKLFSLKPKKFWMGAHAPQI